MHLIGIPAGETKVNEDEEIIKEKQWSHFQSKQDGVSLFLTPPPS